MPTQSDDDCLEDQRKQQPQHINRTAATSFGPVTPAEYIYNSMLPPPTAPAETVAVARAGGKRALMSLDLFPRPEDVAWDGGLGALSGGDDAQVRSLRSADFVEELLRHVATDAPPPSSTAAAAAASDGRQPCPQQKQEETEHDDDEFCPGGFCPILSLTAKLERISTADCAANCAEDVAPLNETFRITSGEWVQDFASESAGKNLGPMHPALFLDAPDTAGSSSDTTNPPRAGMGLSGLSGLFPEEYQLPLAPSDWVQATEHLSTALPLHPPSSGSAPPQSLPPPLPASNSAALGLHLAPAVTAVPDTGAAANSAAAPSASASTASAKKKRRKKRAIDESCAVVPTENDVLFGRGGFTNTHKGNIAFRKKAMELRPWYEQATTSKEEKYQISDVLVESVKCEGHRFLERGEDGLWHEVAGNGARKKASQALRERVRGARRSGAARGGAGVRPAAEAETDGGSSTAAGLIGTLLPAPVVA